MKRDPLDVYEERVVREVLEEALRTKERAAGSIGDSAMVHKAEAAALRKALALLTEAAS